MRTPDGQQARKLSSIERQRLAVHALVAERSVVRVYRGDRVSPYTTARVVRSAEALGLPLPPGRTP
jgi:hypothetical protein